MAKVKSGDPFRPSARVWNTFVDIADRFDEGKFLDADGQFRQNANLVRVKNDTGGNVGRFAVLGISGIVYTPGQNTQEFKNGNFGLTGATPVVATHTGKFVVTQEPVNNGKIGWAAAAGVTPVQIDVNATWHEYADVKASSDELSTKPGGGARILYQETGTGTGKWAVIRFCELPFVTARFDLDNAMATTDATETADIDVCTVVGYSGQNITVTNHTASSDKIFEGDAGDYGTAYYDPVNDAWYIIQMECP